MKLAREPQPTAPAEAMLTFEASRAIPDLGLRSGDSLVIELRHGVPIDGQYCVIRQVSEDPLALREALDRGDLRLYTPEKDGAELTEYLGSTPAPQRRTRFGRLRLVKDAPQRASRKQVAR